MKTATLVTVAMLSLSVGSAYTDPPTRQRPVHRPPMRGWAVFLGQKTYTGGIHKEQRLEYSQRLIDRLRG
jgi:hypothetical protein